MCYLLYKIKPLIQLRSKNIIFYDSLQLVKYTKIIGYECLSTGRTFYSLNEAKEVCSSDSNCVWILDKWCNINPELKEYYICNDTDTLHENDESCAYEKHGTQGKNYISTMI